MKSDFLFQSILDNDFYKFTMQQGVLRLFPDARVKYQFINRGKHKFPIGFDKALEAAVENMRLLRLQREERLFLENKCPYLDHVFLDFLEHFEYNPEEVSIEQKGEELSVSISGLWYRTILWEVPLMALICELFYKLQGMEPTSTEQVVECAKNKVERYRKLGVTVAEFGTRRRFSYHVHATVVQALRKFGGDSFVGSSNVHFAMLDGSKPIGTHAHEWFMYHAAKYGFNMANRISLENWVNVYRGDLGIALSDTYTTDVFFRQFDKMFSKLFDGVRHDSGDPLLFADKVIKHYESLGVDPGTKTIIFSDALNYDKVARIADHCRDKIKASFGIGTNLTNDVGHKAMNIVIKMVAAETDKGHWNDTVKLSDEKGKYTGSESMIRLALETLELSDKTTTD